MEFLEHNFVYGLTKTPSIVLYKDTFVLIEGITENQKLQIVYGCAYIETTEREFKTSQNFELVIPQKDERLLSFQKQITDPAYKLKCRFFFGTLEELMLAELYYSHHLYERTFFNYAKKELRYGDLNYDFVSIRQISADKFELQVRVKLPMSVHKQTAVFNNLCNEFRLIERLFMKIKVNPPPAHPEGSRGDLNKLIFKYFPQKPYK